MSIHRLKVFILVGLLCFTSTQVHAMGIGFKICLASDSSGVVTDEGKPIEGAVVQRKVINDGKEYVDEVITGPEGTFFFSAIYERTLLKYVPFAQPVVSQEVTITFQGEAHSAWRLVKADWEYLGEVNSGQAIVKGNVKPMVMRCELSSQEYSRYAPDSARGLHGKCLLEWEEKPEK